MTKIIFKILIQEHFISGHAMRQPNIKLNQHTECICTLKIEMDENNNHNNNLRLTKEKKSIFIPMKDMMFNQSQQGSLHIGRKSIKLCSHCR